MSGRPAGSRPPVSSAVYDSKRFSRSRALGRAPMSCKPVTAVRSDRRPPWPFYTRHKWRHKWLLEAVVAGVRSSSWKGRSSVITELFLLSNFHSHTHTHHLNHSSSSRMTTNHIVIDYSRHENTQLFNHLFLRAISSGNQLLLE